MLEFELPEHARINGRARVLREQGYRIFAVRFEKLGDEARAEIALPWRARLILLASSTMTGISRSVFRW